jgi:tetratricopeptide (TPR) repeat protein
VYAALVGVGLAAAFGYAALQLRWRHAAVLFVLPLVWTPFTALRASDWTDNQRLFGATLERTPDHPEALFHVAYDLHTAQGNCEAALPLYAKAMPRSRRAGNNLQACLVELQRWEEAARLGPALAARDSDNPNPALNTARALSRLGDQQSAERWARTGIERRSGLASGHVLLGNVLGLQQRYEEARRSFEQALEIDPGLESARRGRDLALRRLAEARSATRR